MKIFLVITTGCALFAPCLHAEHRISYQECVSLFIDAAVASSTPALSGAKHIVSVQCGTEAMELVHASVDESGSEGVSDEGSVFFQIERLKTTLAAEIERIRQLSEQ